TLAGPCPPSWSPAWSGGRSARRRRHLRRYSSSVLSEDLAERAGPDHRDTHRRWSRIRRLNRRLPEEDTWVKRPKGSVRWIVFDLIILTIIVAVALVLVLHLWNVDLRIPFGYGGDGLQHARDAKTIVQTGWVQTTPRLGAPFG